MSMRSVIAATTVCLMICAGAVFGQDLQQGPEQDAARALSANPFSRPGYTVSIGTTQQPSLLTAPVALELRATMVSGDKALVNINGTILSVGQELEGYRVLSIAEGRAVLSNNGERLILNVYERQLGIDQNNGIGRR